MLNPIHYILIALLVVLVFFSAFFSGSEMVYAAVNKIRLEKKADEGDNRAKLANSLVQRYPSLITTILLGNNLVNIAASSAATILFTYLDPKNGEWIALAVITIIILIFGEIIPKTILTKFSFSLTLIFAKPLRWLEIIFKPIVFVVTKMIDKVSPIWTPKKDEEEEDTTGEELINMVEEIEEEGFIDNDTSELIQSAIEFKDTTAHEIMTPRVDIIAIDINTDIDEIINDPDMFKFSRVVIYDETIDNVVGFLNTRKFYTAILAGEEVNLRDLITEVLYVHKTKSISGVLKMFKKSGRHIAIVVDEFGGTLGVITLEDIIEEIVGDIWDETDKVEEEFIEKSETEFIVDGDMNLYDMFDLVEFKDDDFDSEYETVAGWCTEVLDDFPKVNDAFTFKNLNVKILEVNGVRVEKVSVEVIEIEEEDE